LEIRVNNKDIETAIKLLKRKLQKDGLLRELKERRFYEKPSVKMKRKQREAQKKKLRSLKVKSRSNHTG